MGGFLSGVASAFAHPIRSAQQASMGIGHGLYAANHWLAPHGYGVFSPHSLAKAGEQTGSQLVHGFDPRTRAGLANIASIFAGGPKDGGFEGEMAMSRMQGTHEFVPYSHETGGPLDRGVAHEGPIRPGKGYNPSIQGMVQRAHTNPFVRAAKDVTSREQQNALEKQSALDMMRQQSARAMQARRQIDEHLHASPMSGKPSQVPEHNGSYLHGPSVLNHPNFQKAMLQRRYQAGLGHNHLN